MPRLKIYLGLVLAGVGAGIAFVLVSSYAAPDYEVVNSGDDLVVLPVAAIDPEDHSVLKEALSSVLGWWEVKK